MANLYSALTSVLAANDCVFVRSGKGSHTANEVLKQAGLPKAF